MPATPKQRKIAIMGYRLDNIKDLNFRLGIKTKVQVCPLAFSIELFLFIITCCNILFSHILFVKSMPDFCLVPE